jgi:hypothetical protein
MKHKIAPYVAATALLAIAYGTKAEAVTGDWSTSTIGNSVMHHHTNVVKCVNGVVTVGISNAGHAHADTYIVNGINFHAEVTIVANGFGVVVLPNYLRSITTVDPGHDPLTQVFGECVVSVPEVPTTTTTTTAVAPPTTVVVRPPVVTVAPPVVTVAPPTVTIPPVVEVNEPVVPTVPTPPTVPPTGLPATL